MDFEMLHPAQKLVTMMDRIYHTGLTTTSGGNLSIRDSDGNVWITPSSIDKGTLKPADIVRVSPDGEIHGIHKPSVELPFHLGLYKKLPEVNAVVHAHPAALVAFALARKIPDTSVMAVTKLLCGDIRMAAYKTPGSEALSEAVSSVFDPGVRAVMMENHGVVVAHKSLMEAFMVFETLDFCARILINSRIIGKPVPLTDEQIDTYRSRVSPALAEFVPAQYSSEELLVRDEMTTLIHRAYNQGLFTSTQGTFSQRLSDGSFVITPYGVDREYLGPRDLVTIRNGWREAGKIPSRSLKLHEAIYEKHPEIKSVIIAHPPNIMAFAITGAEFNSVLIPESYIMLRDVVRLPYGVNFLDPYAVAKELSLSSPAAIVANDCVILTGTSLLNAFDRLEVLEFSAKSVISAENIGDIVTITDDEVEEINVAFNLK